MPSLVDEAGYFYPESRIGELPAGVSEWAVHPGVGDAELRAAMPSREVRQSDLALVIAPEARQIVEEEGIILLDYRVFQQAWRAARAGARQGGLRPAMRAQAQPRAAPEDP